MKSRNRLQRISFLAVLLAALVHGCAWDDSLYNEFVIDNGSDKERVQGCKNLKVIRIYDDNNNYTDYDESNNDGKYANAFKYKLCPRDAPNCMHAESKDADSTNKIGICRNDCPKTHAICKDKCLERASKPQDTGSESQNNNIKFHSSLHIKSCDNDNLVCDDDYYNRDNDIINGCEMPLSTIHVKKVSEDTFDCNNNDYYDLNDDLKKLKSNGDLENLEDNKPFDGCEFQLSLVHVKKDSEGDFVCNDDYYDLNSDLDMLKEHKNTDGCEFQLSLVHVDNMTPKNEDGFWKCIEDYYDFDQEATNGCEFQLSLVNVDKTNPITSNGSDFSWNCKDGYADLDESRKNGCEINGWMDSEHCGEGIIIDREQGTRRKGEVCINGKTCIMGECKVSCGQEGIIECGGYCVNVKGSDNAHCGACGQTCELDPTTNRRTSTAAVACGGGYCHATACMPGYRLETGQTPNTCTKCDPDEYTTSATATECTLCPKTPGAKTMRFDATRNLCVAEDCEAGWHVYKDACEENTTQHCGTQREICAQLEYGTATCDGQCRYACNAGYYYKNNCSSSPYCCFACPQGTYSSTGATQCTQCPQGTYNSSTGATQCSIVPAGRVGADCGSGYTGCKSYSRCNYDANSHRECMDFYGYYSGCRKIDGYNYCTDDTETKKKSCNRSYNGCSQGQTCKPHNNNDQYSYGYCN